MLISIGRTPSTHIDFIDLFSNQGVGSHNRSPIAQGTQRAATIASPSLLVGKVFDQQGKPLVASHASKGKVRYRYYVSRSLQHDSANSDGGMRIPALELEKVVCDGVASEARQPLALVDRIGLQLSLGETGLLVRGAEQPAVTLSRRNRQTVRKLVSDVCIARDTISVQLDTGFLIAELGLRVPENASATVSITIPATLKRSGHAMRLLQADGRAPGTPEPQEHLVRLLHRARSWWNEMLNRGLSPTHLQRDKASPLPTSRVSSG